MYFCIEEKSGDVLLPKMSNWSKIDDMINTSELKHNRILVLAHHAVRYKLEAANMHISMLKQAYKIRNTTSEKIGSITILFLTRTMMENIIFNLSSLLDSVTHEINQIYNFNIPIDKVQMDHQFNSNNCVRCKLNSGRDELGSLLDWEFPRFSKDKNVANNSWYYDFTRYRNQIMHRTIYFLHTRPGKVFLPDDPAILDMQGLIWDENHKPIIGKHMIGVPKNYEHEREMRDYSSWCFEKIFGITEKIYGYLIDKRKEKS
jgi:hypothetical protein